MNMTKLVLLSTCYYEPMYTELPADWHSASHRPSTPP